MRAAIASGFVLAALAAPQAHGASVIANEERCGPSDGSECRDMVELIYEAAAGESNAVRISRDGATLTIVDSAPLAVDGSCTRVDATTARCPVGESEESRYIFGLGDGNDSFDGQNLPFVRVEAGPGDDAIGGSSGADHLDGGGGRDTIGGGAGDDVLTDGDSSSTGIGPDVLNGGGGSDRADYDSHDVRIEIDLADPAADGAAGENDALSAIENLRGGGAGGRLQGDDGPNALQAQAGTWTLSGRGGGDVIALGRGGGVLEGDAGNDVMTVSRGTGVSVLGGEGDDRIRVRGMGTASGDTGDDRVDAGLSGKCGPGRDILLDPGVSLPLPRDCELVGLALGDNAANRARAFKPGLVLDPHSARTTGRTLTVGLRTFARHQLAVIVRTQRGRRLATVTVGRPSRTLRIRLKSRASGKLVLRFRQRDRHLSRWTIDALLLQPR